jgi:hypothetical protein
MNVIGLTGANMRAMADVAEQLLALTAAARIAVSVILYVEDVDQVRILRANNLGLTEIWRIGRDRTRPELDLLLDAHIDDSRGDEAVALAVTVQFARFTQFVSLTNQRRAVQAAAPITTTERHQA